jgi:hypothetical protein
MKPFPVFAGPQGALAAMISELGARPRAAGMRAAILRLCALLSGAEGHER